MSRTEVQRKKLLELRGATAKAEAEEGKVSMRLTDPSSDDWTHEELFTETEDGTKTFTVYHEGDVVEVTPDTAEHLFMSGQAELAVDSEA